MRTIKSIILFFNFVSLIIILVGCNKESNQPVQLYQSPTASDYKIHRAIETFKADIKSILKVSEEISIDSLVWYMEASLNETYARSDNNIEQLLIDSSFVEISMTNNHTVLLSDLNVAYNTLIDTLSGHYHSVSGDKSLLMVDISILLITDHNITVRMKDYIANRPVPPNSWTFGASDHWYWGLGLGKCTETGFQGLDATTQITAYANNSLPFGGSMQYFINISNSGVIFPWEVEASSPNPFGYVSTLLYFNSSDFLPETDDCLEPAAMNYYLSNLKQIALMPQYLPNSKSVASYLCQFDLLTNGYWGHFHKATITYGHPTVAIEPPEEL